MITHQIGHPSFWSGLKIRNHRTCRVWIGARLPFRNTHQKGIYPFWGQTRHYVPDEIGGLSRWADPLTTVTYSLTVPSSALPVTHMSYSSLFIFVLYLFHIMLVMNLFSRFIPLSPTVFRSLFRTSHVSTL